MSVSDTIFRHQCILRKLSKAPASLEEIRDFYELECEIHGYEFRFSNRTFLRDKDKILSLHKKDICYNANTKKYYIDEDEVQRDFGHRISDAYNTFLALNLAENIADFVFLEKRRPQGLEHFSALLLALRESHKVTFLYEKFNDEPISTRTVQPLALKEFESRWYLLARSLSDQSVKIFALDRMQQLETAAAHFPKQAAFDVKAYFEHSFGISRPSDKTAEPEIVVLQFGNNYGKYIKSLPLHHSQQIVDESSNTVTISVQVYLTPDFVNQLLSHGEQLKVLSPKILQDQMKEILLRAAQQY